MTDKIQKLPNAAHPIAIAHSVSRVVARAGDVVIADTVRALALREASYPVVFYIPRADVEMGLLVQTELSTHCPYKGDATHFSMPIAGERSANIAWSYETPDEAVAEIAGHIAFYSDRVVTVEEWEAGKQQ
jgi:uncharacterized protein (DUF427 family)